MAHDVIVLGGGPAGSTCARFLVRGGARVAVVDRAEFPRVKLCGGWVSAPIWDELEMTPADYPGGLWEWRTCHVAYRGQSWAVPCRGWFIRRYELDDFLLRATGAELSLGVPVRRVDRDPDGMWSIGGVRARYLVGAAGTHCPVVRVCAPARPDRAVGAQENEFRADPDAIARTRIGNDGEPELLLHDDVRGYSWNVAKTDWINVGAGTVEATEVRAAWRAARAHFSGAGHLPAEAAAELDAVRGHSYYLFHPAHLDRAVSVDADGRGGAALVGDSLGLAQPVTAEGILPAVVSGKLAAEAILAGDLASYPDRMRAHPLIEEYERIYRLKRVAGEFRGSAVGSGGGRPFRLGHRALATGFAWLFSGARLPAPRMIDVMLTGAERLLAARGRKQEAA